jgi:hypothetical protein
MQSPERSRKKDCKKGSFLAKLLLIHTEYVTNQKNGFIARKYILLSNWWRRFLKMPETYCNVAILNISSFWESNGKGNIGLADIRF